MALALFDVDKFTGSDPVFTPLPAAVADGLLAIAGRHWPHLDLTAAEAVGDVVADAAVAANSHNFRLAGPHGAVVLKRITRADILAVAEAQMALQAHCAAAGAPVPRPLPTRDGGLLAREGDQAWCLLEFAEGRYFQGGEDDLALCGRAIGRLHRVLAELPAALTPAAARPPYFTDEERAGLEQMRARRAEWPALFGAATAEVLAEHWHMVEEWWRRLDGEPALAVPAAAVHFDLHPHNLLVAPGRGLVLDLDSVVRAPLPLALGFAVAKLGKRAERHRRTTGAAAPVPAESRRCLLEAVAAELGALPDLATLELFARAEVLRRFLSVCRYGLRGQPIVWNGPLVHLAGLAECDLLFSA